MRTTKVIKNHSNAFDAVQLIKKTGRDHRNSHAVNVLLNSVPPFEPTRKWFETLSLVIDRVTTYRLDDQGKEQVKTPDRFIIKDGVGDCDDYSALWVAILTRLGIKHHIKIVKYSKDADWQHVYIVVPVIYGSKFKYLNIDGKPGRLVLDGVLLKETGIFGQEVDYIESKIFQS